MDKIVKVVSLDFWGTVAVFNPKYSKARTAFLAKLWNIPEDEAHARYQFIKRSCDHEAEVRGTAVTPLVAVKRLLEGTDTGWSAVDVLDEIEKLVRENPPILGDGIASEIFELQTYHDYVIGVSSNTNFISGKLIADIFSSPLGGIDWNFSVYSDEIGVSKPDPEFYNMVLKEGRRAYLDGKPAAVVEPHSADFLHIGDNSICDQKGARSAGMRAWLVKSPEETLTYLQGLKKELVAYA